MAIYGIFGAGGFGREVMPLARSMLATSQLNTPYELVFVVDSLEATEINGHRVLSTDQFLGSSSPKHFNVAVAESTAREMIASRLSAEGAMPFSIIASSAIVLDGSSLGEGAIICPFVTITSNASIGRFFHANLYSYVAHDCVVGNFVTFAPQVACNGNVHVGNHAYVGTGAVIRQGRARQPTRIGERAVIGMGAVVTKDVEPGVTVVGNPARPMPSRG